MGDSFAENNPVFFICTPLAHAPNGNFPMLAARCVKCQKTRRFTRRQRARNACCSPLPESPWWRGDTVIELIARFPLRCSCIPSCLRL